MVILLQGGNQLNKVTHSIKLHWDQIQQCSETPDGYVVLLQ